jgi:hypothetical protein
MSDIIRTLCDRLAHGVDLDPHLLASRLGTVGERNATSPIKVVPFDARFASAEVFVSETSGQTLLVIFVPAVQLTVSMLQDSLGVYDESPRLHPFDPRKLVFAPPSDGSRAYDVRVIANVSADEPAHASAQVQRLTVTYSPAISEQNDDRKPTSEERTTWTRLKGEPARFVVTTLRDSTLDAVRSELERVLGIYFTPIPGNGTALECAMPACELRLSSASSENPHLLLFSLVGGNAPNAEDISDTIAAHLRGANCDWYRPAAAIFDEHLLDQNALVSQVAPRWLAWCSGEEREIGLEVLTGIAELWLTAARRAADPIADVRRRIAEFHGWSRYSPPKARLDVLVSYAIQEQLSMIEEEVFQLTLMSDAERATVPGLSARLAELRVVVVALAEPAQKNMVDSIIRQQQQVIASIDELAQRVGGARA